MTRKTNLINDGGVCGAVPATPGLLNTYTNIMSWAHLYEIRWRSCLTVWSSQGAETLWSRVTLQDSGRMNVAWGQPGGVGGGGGMEDKVTPVYLTVPFPRCSLIRYLPSLQLKFNSLWGWRRLLAPRVSSITSTQLQRRRTIPINTTEWKEQ